MAHSANNDEGDRNVARSIRDVQQSFAESLGYFQETIWDLLSADQANILQRKIENIICDPQVPHDINAADRNEAEKQVANQCKINQATRETMFQSVWEQRKYTNRQSLTSIIYVLVATDETNHNIATDSIKWTFHPVFRARRCVSYTTAIDNCCMIFVDDNGRVYQNWSAYVANNKLPAGVMVAPRHGIYKLVNGHVQLESWLTPAASTNCRVLETLDTTASVGGFAAALVPIAAFLTLPVSAPIMAAAGIVGLGCAGYATARSSAQLVDRSTHEQSISLGNRTARNQWLGVAAGTVGIGAAGATKVLTAATNAGREVGAVTQLTVNSINISSVMISATGLGNGLADIFLKYMEDDEISAMDALQLSASLVLFTHTVYNFKLASTIINETSNNKIGAYRDTLSNRQRRMFDKLSKETIRTNGAIKGKAGIIRNVNEIPSRQEFNDLYKINQRLNQKGVRPAFATDRQGIVLNDQVLTSGAELRASIQHGIGADVIGRVTQPMPETFQSGNTIGTINGPFIRPSQLLAPNLVTLEQTDAANSKYTDGVNALRLSSLLVNGGLIQLSSYGQSIFEHIMNAESFGTVLLSLADNFPQEVMNCILNMTEIFMDDLWDELHELLQFFVTSESVIYKIGTYILQNYRGLNVMQLSEHFSEILFAVKQYFLSLNPNNTQGSSTQCQICQGYYKICNL